MTRKLIALAAAVCISGCTLSAKKEQSASSAVDITPVGAIANSGDRLPHSVAIALVPQGAGSIAYVRERRYENGLEQHIVLEGGSGENRIDISVEAESGTKSNYPVPLYKPSESGVRSEIVNRIPGVRMQISPAPMNNAYGPFGIAVGAMANGTRCVYAWQWIENVRSEKQQQGGFFKRIGMSSASSGSPASIRLRLCRANATADELASYMEALELGTPMSLERVWSGGPVSVEAGSGALRGNNVVGGGTGGRLESLVTSRPAPAPRAERPVAVRKDEPEEARPERRAPAPRKVVRRERREPVQRQEPVEQQQVVARPRNIPQPVQQVMPPQVTPLEASGQRFLAPLSQANVAPQYGARPMMQGQAAQGMVPNRGLDQSLPSAAYKGPTRNNSNQYVPPNMQGQQPATYIPSPSSRLDQNLPTAAYRGPNQATGSIKQWRPANQAQN